MNILENIPFNPDKPAVYIIRKTDTINYIAVGLLQDQLLPDHKTGIPTILTVLKGSVLFTILEEKHVLNELDTFQIPVNVIHHVLGIDEKNAITLVQEKK